MHPYSTIEINKQTDMSLKRIMLSERNQTRKHTDYNTIAFEKEEVRLQGQKTDQELGWDKG